MTSAVDNTTSEPAETAEPDKEKVEPPHFILYMAGPAYDEALARLTIWVRHLLIPVYGRELSSSSLWCSRWWEHPEAVAQFYALWMVWQDLTGPGSSLAGPAMWHRDYAGVALSALRAPDGPFAGCKPGVHRPKEPLLIEQFPENTSRR